MISTLGAGWSSDALSLVVFTAALTVMASAFTISEQLLLPIKTKPLSKYTSGEFSNFFIGDRYSFILQIICLQNKNTGIGNFTKGCSDNGINTNLLFLLFMIFSTKLLYTYPGIDIAVF